MVILLGYSLIDIKHDLYFFSTKHRIFSPNGCLRHIQKQKINNAKWKTDSLNKNIDLYYRHLIGILHIYII